MTYESYHLLNTCWCIVSSKEYRKSLQYPLEATLIRELELGVTALDAKVDFAFAGVELLNESRVSFADVQEFAVHFSSDRRQALIYKELWFLGNAPTNDHGLQEPTLELFYHRSTLAEPFCDRDDDQR